MYCKPEKFDIFTVSFLGIRNLHMSGRSTLTSLIPV